MDEDIGKVLLAQAARLRSMAFSQHRFVEGELALRVVSYARREALAGEIGRAAERIADADVAFAVHGRVSQPTVESAGGIRRLPVQLGVALFVQAELVPANAAAVRGRSDGMLRQDGLMIAEVAVHEPLDQLVALRIEAAFRARLRDAEHFLIEECAGIPFLLDF
jgi:hypothetical protein